MTVKAEWDSTEQIAIVITFESPWSWDDFDEAVQDIVTLVSEVEHKICLIYDAEKSTRYPSANVLSHYKKALAKLAPYIKLHISFGVTEFTKMLVPVILGVMGGRMEYVDTLEEARQLAAEVFKS